ncbi:cysteine hydrolase family protein [Arthrobacter sedimenti]|uniref:cysteine hydrolase family protein n=1 Tax=Arthrobacter sedimenti TaxID=2694931 RepID=UPI000B35C120|nr:isochorismatase family cysteine hydrolase [Arthrobacter sedimenti]OUM44924.1 cysteine hydrolase [Arthrobacter agilis]
MPRSDAPAGSERGRAALLIIDMQNAFFEDEVLAGAQEDLVRACNALIDVAQRGRAPVLVARTEHLPDRSTWTVSMLDDDQGFIFRGTHQAGAVDGLRVEGLETVTKTRDSAFFGTDLAERLRGHGVERLVLAGVSTHNCVAHTGADAFAHDFRVSYVLDAIGSTNAQYAAAMLEILSVEYRQAVISRSEAEALLT